MSQQKLERLRALLKINKHQEDVANLAYVKSHTLWLSEKKKLAQLKTLLNQRINSVKQEEESALNKTLAS